MPNSFSKSVNHVLRLFAHNPTAKRVEMSGRRVIVTGASGLSLGYETAKILASWGASVVVTCKGNIMSMEDSLNNYLRSIDVGENKVKAHALDLNDVDSANRFATWYGKNYDGRLHVLINNAGIHKNVFNPGKNPL